MAQEDILEARERRWKHRLSLANQFDAPVITVTLNIPGPSKNRRKYEEIHKILSEELITSLLRNGFNYLVQEKHHGADGDELYLVVLGDVKKIKGITTDVEGKHPLGRLADIDVMTNKGKIVTRQDLSLPERCCFLCPKPVRLCRLGKSHSLKELLQAVEKIITNWEKQR